VWAAFGGREQMLAAPARKVRRVTQYLQAQNEYEYEQSREQERKLDEAERDRARISSRSR